MIGLKSSRCSSGRNELAFWRIFVFGWKNDTFAGNAKEEDGRAYSLGDLAQSRPDSLFGLVVDNMM